MKKKSNSFLIVTVRSVVIALAIFTNAAYAQNFRTLIVLTEVEVKEDTIKSAFDSMVKEGVRVNQLFPDININDDPEGLRRLFEVLIPVAGRSDDQLQAFQEMAMLTLNIEDAYFETPISDPIAKYIGDPDPAASGTCFVKDRKPVPDNKQWSLEMVNAKQAWRLSPKEGGRAQGEGIRICHPDTGWAQHSEYLDGTIDKDHSFDFVLESNGAEDPLPDYGFPGHGTSTGSVIAGGTKGIISGSAPKATLVPLRATASVINIFDKNLAEAVNHSIDVANCDIISISLGGVGFRNLERAIKRAQRKNVIVLAAAGNCVRKIVKPAAYDEVIAVTGVDVEGDRWIGSSRGNKSDFAAPAQHVFRALRESPDDTNSHTVKEGEGTSYAVATTAGIAALWLAHHNISREHFRTGNNGPTLSDYFRQMVCESAQRKDDPVFKELNIGCGIIDARALLELPLPPQLQRSIGLTNTRVANE